MTENNAIRHLLWISTFITIAMAVLVMAFVGLLLSNDQFIIEIIFAICFGSYVGFMLGMAHGLA